MDRWLDHAPLGRNGSRCAPHDEYDNPKRGRTTAQTVLRPACSGLLVPVVAAVIAHSSISPTRPEIFREPRYRCEDGLSVT